MSASCGSHAELRGMCAMAVESMYWKIVFQHPRTIRGDQGRHVVL